MITLRCNKCLCDLPTTCFSVNRRAGDRGFQYTCKECHRVVMRKHNLAKYALTPDSFQTLWDEQSGECAICSASLNRSLGPAGYAIDHNHDTGAVRGILCQLCNQGIGCLKDSPHILSRAMTYLNDNGHYGPKTASN